MKRNLIVLALSAMLSSCAGTAAMYTYYVVGAGAYGAYWWLTRPTVGRAIDDAVVVSKPKNGDRLATTTVETGSGSLSTHSYAAKNKQLCFMHFSKSNNFKYQLGLVEDKESAERPLSVHSQFTADVLDHKTSVVSYEDKETTTYKDSTGKVIATADRPVTRYTTESSYQIKVCFDDVKLDRKGQFYAVLGTSGDTAKQLDDNDYYAAWKFAD
jgi:hypothetical protein